MAGWMTLVINNKLRLIRSSVSLWQSSAQDQVNRERLLTRLRIGHIFLTYGYLMDIPSLLWRLHCAAHGEAHPPRVSNFSDMRRAHFPNIDGDYDEAMRVILAEGDQCNFDATKLIAFLTACDVLDKL